MADAAGAAVDRTLIADGSPYYLRISNLFRADLGLTFANSELAASYSLSLVPDLLTLKVAPFHVGDLRYSYTASRFVFSLTQTLGAGERIFLGAGRASPLVGLAPVQDPRPTAPAPPALATPGSIDSGVLPGARMLPSVASRSTAAVSYRWERRLSSAFVVGYQMYGGLGRDAQRYLALQRVVDAGASVAYGMSARVDLVSGLVFARGWNSSDNKYALLTLSESWLYKWTSTTSLDLGAGISSRETESSDEPTRLTTTPVAAIGLTQALTGRDTTGSLRLGVTYAPLVDSVTGQIANRLAVLGSATAAHGDLHAGVGAGLSQAIPASDPGAVTSLTANVYAGYQISSWLGASLSAYVARQTIVTTGLPAATLLPSGVTWGVYGGLYAVSPTLRF